MGNLAFTYANQAVGIAKQILLVPLYLKYVSLGCYGAWLASGNAIAMLGLLDFGLPLILTQRLASAEGSADHEEFVSNVGAGLVLTALSVLLICGAVILLSPFIPAWVHAPREQYIALARAVVLEGLGSAAVLFGLWFWSISQAWQRSLAPGAANLAASLLSIVATVGGLFAGMGVVAIGLGGLVRGVSSLVILATCVTVEWRRRQLPLPPIRTPATSSLLRLMTPVLFARVGNTFANNCESWVVSAFINPESAAVLSLTGRLFQACIMVLSPIGSSAYAGLAHLASGASRARILSIVSELFAKYSLAMAMVFGPALALNHQFVSLWVGRTRFGGNWLTAALCLAAIVTSYTNLQGLVAPALGEISGPAWCALVLAGLRLSFLFALVDRLGLMAVPLSTVLSWGFIGVVYLYFVLRRRLEQNSTAFVRAVASEAPTVAVCVGGGLLWTLVTPAVVNWAWLTAESLAAILGVCLLALATSVHARRRVAPEALALFRGAWRKALA